MDNTENGLPHGSVLSPILFNIYTNDQPLHEGTYSFIYEYDLCVTAQYSSFTRVERTIGHALDKLTQYYISNSLRANPDKTQVTAFHLRNKEAKRSLKVVWNRADMENTPPEVFALVLLFIGRWATMSIYMKLKMETHNHRLRKLSNSNLVVNASRIRTTLLQTTRHQPG